MTFKSRISVNGPPTTETLRWLENCVGRSTYWLHHSVAGEGWKCYRENRTWYLEFADETLLAWYILQKS